MSAARAGHRLLMYDPNNGGHDLVYIHFQAEQARHAGFEGTVYMLVSPKFVRDHPESVALAEGTSRPRVEFVALTVNELDGLRRAAHSAAQPPVADVLNGELNPASHAAHEWALLEQYAGRLEPTHIFISNLDNCLPPILAGRRLPAPFSGINHIFRSNARPDLNGAPSRSALHLYRRFIYNRMLSHPQLRTVFHLDPDALEELGLAGHPKLVYLPSPLSLPPPEPARVSALRAALAVEPGRMVGLLFGVVEVRKGYFELLEALRQLPDELNRRLCIVLTGRGRGKLPQRIEREAATLAARHPVQVICRFEQVLEPAVAAYFALSDFALLPYQRHADPSGVLLLAAAAQKPSLFEKFGWMGYIGAHYRLGLAVDTTQPAEIARGLAAFLSGAPAAQGDPEDMRRLASQNTVEGYGRAIFEHLTRYD